MATTANALRWDGQPGHYEVYYLTLTDPTSEVGIWIRYTMVAPLTAVGDDPSASLWFLAMDPHGRVFGRKQTFPVDQLSATSDPFRLQIAGSTLTDGSMDGGFEDVSWDLRWAPSPKPYEHVHPLLRGVASTILTLPNADVEIEGTIRFDGRALELRGARGGQAHLWGSKHANSWAWVHCNDFVGADREPVADTFIDGVSVVVSRFGREVGPNTPVVGRIDGADFASRSPLRVLRNPSTFGLTSWRFEAVDGARKLAGEIEADRNQLAGVTYHDPDGDLAYCYNSEVASMRLHVYDRSRLLGGWSHRATLLAEGRTHFEYAQREPVPELELLTS
jgi:hypothetical protein